MVQIAWQALVCHSPGGALKLRRSNGHKRSLNGPCALLDQHVSEKLPLNQLMICRYQNVRFPEGVGQRGARFHCTAACRRGRIFQAICNHRFQQRFHAIQVALPSSMQCTLIRKTSSNQTQPPSHEVHYSVFHGVGNKLKLTDGALPARWNLPFRSYAAAVWDSHVC
jgi:hypothetical protein